jgi:hypothetical protein
MQHMTLFEMLNIQSVLLINKVASLILKHVSNRVIKHIIEQCGFEISIH